MDVPLVSRPSWQSQATCLTVDGEVFFPADGGSTLPALRVCLTCPVVVECATWALEFKHTDATIGDVGVWGATTEQVRKQIRRGALTLPQALQRAAARVAAADRAAATSRRPCPSRTPERLPGVEHEDVHARAAAS